jgi:hypothetical protein
VQLKDFTEGNLIQIAFRKITMALCGSREIYLLKKVSSPIAEGKLIPNYNTA